MESLLSPVISAILEKLLPFFLSRSILFLSSFVTVMYSLESYEGPALHLFKEFRDVGFRGGRRKSEKNMLVLFEAIRGLGKNSYCIYIKGTDYQTVTPDSLSAFIC